MDMKTLRTDQEQFVSTANHWTKVIQPMYSLLTRETVGGMSREFSLRRFRSIHFDLRRCRHLLHASRHLLYASSHLSRIRCSARFSLASASLITLRLMSPSFK